MKCFVLINSGKLSFILCLSPVEEMHFKNMGASFHPMAEGTWRRCTVGGMCTCECLRWKRGLVLPAPG